MRELFWWKSLSAKNIAARVLLAHNEQRRHRFREEMRSMPKIANVPKRPPKKLLSICGPWPFAQWGIDWIERMPLGRSQVKYTVIAVDYFTKWAKAKPLSTITEAKITDFVWKNIVCRFRIPYFIIIDNERQFHNTKFQTFCDNLGIKQGFSSPAYPKANEQVEAVNKIIKHCLKMKLDGKKGAWVDELPQVL